MSPTETAPLALIVDDELTNRMILRSLLKKQGYDSVEAENGRQAVELFRERQPDIIFMDVMMPEMDGYEATRIIKAEAGNRFIPVIFLTAVTDEESLPPASTPVAMTFWSSLTISFCCRARSARWSALPDSTAKSRACTA